MSDFLGRIAARAVGEGPAAEPRVPAAFEGLGGELPHEVHAEEIVPSAPVEAAPAMQAPVGEPPAPLVDHEPVLAGLREPHETPQRAEPRAAVDADPFVPAPPANPGRAARPPDPPVTAAEPRRVRDEPAPPSIVPPQEPQRPPVGAVPAAVATPIAAAISTPRRAHGPPSSETAAVAVEESPVRVHIGRLEVRANLQQPSPPRSRQRAEVRAEDLSLADYLRGKRVRA